MKTMYTILSESDYHDLNASISMALGLFPEMAYQSDKPDIIAGFCVMPITVEVQTVCPELLKVVELVEILPVLTPEIQTGDNENPT